MKLTGETVPTYTVQYDPLTGWRDYLVTTSKSKALQAYNTAMSYNMQYAWRITVNYILTSNLEK